MRTRPERIEQRSFAEQFRTTANGCFVFIAGVFAVVNWSGCGGETSAVSAEMREILPQTPDLSGKHQAFRERVERNAAIAHSREATTDSVVMLSRLYHANGYLQEAMACYEVLLGLEPENPRWMHLYAFLLSTYGYADDAEQLWRSVIERDAAYVPAKIRLADVLLKSNRLSEAGELYAQVSKEDPKNPYALLGLGRVAIGLEQWEQARDYLKGASTYSDGKIGRDLLVTAYENLGQESLALMIRGESKASGSFVDIPDPWLVEVMKDCYDPAQLMNMGGLAAFGGDDVTGIEWLQRSLEIAPDNAMAHFQIGQLYYQTSQFSLAMKHFEQASALKPDFSDAWLKMVEIEAMRGNPTRSEALFSEGFMKCPKSPAYNMQYALRLIKAGERKRAIGYLKKSIELNPNEAAAYVTLASNLFALNRIESGREYLEQALQVEPGNRLAMTAICFYFIQNGDEERARKWLDAVDIHPRMSAADRLDLKLKFQEKFQ